MSNLFSFLKLELFRLKKYYTVGLVLMIVLIISIFSSPDIKIDTLFASVVMMLMVMSLFAKKEQDNINSLYNTLPIKAKTVINGRYILAIIITQLIVLSLLGATLLMGLRKEVNNDLNVVFIRTSIISGAILTLIAFSGPIYLAFNKKIAFVINIILMVVYLFCNIYLITENFQNEAGSYSKIVYFIPLFALVLIFISYFLSLKIAKNDN